MRSCASPIASTARPCGGERGREVGEVAALVAAAHDQDHRRDEGVEAAARRLDVRGLGVVVVGDTVDRRDVLEHVLDAAEGAHRARDRLGRRAEQARGRGRDQQVAGEVGAGQHDLVPAEERLLATGEPQARGARREERPFRRLRAARPSCARAACARRRGARPGARSRRPRSRPPSPRPSAARRPAPWPRRRRAARDGGRGGPARGSARRRAAGGSGRCPRAGSSRPRPRTRWPASSPRRDRRAACRCCRRRARRGPPRPASRRAPRWSSSCPWCR